MKSILLICLIIAALPCFSQKTALLDKKLKQPIIFTDSVTLEQVKRGYLPIEVKDLDTFYANLGYIETMLSKPQRAKMSSFDLRAGSSAIQVSRIPMAYADRYNVIFTSMINEINAKYVVGDGKKSNKEIAESIKDLKKYLSSNKSLFTRTYEIQPKIYNVVVISE
jgi:hypothetical protein